MDNNKDYIKIDDLFKNRAADGEERFSAAAWKNMEKLLDKGMPKGGGMALSSYILMALLTLGIGAGAVAWQYNTPVTIIALADNTTNGNTAQLLKLPAQTPLANLENNETPPSSKASNSSGNIANLNTISNKNNNHSSKNKNNNNNKPNAANKTIAAALNTATQGQKAAAKEQKPTNTNLQPLAKNNTQAINSNTAMAVQNAQPSTAPVSAVSETKLTPEPQLVLSAAEPLSAPSVTLQSEVVPPKPLTFAAGSATDNVANNKYKETVFDKKANKTYVKQQDDKWYKEVPKKVHEVHILKRKERNDQGKVTGLISDTVKKSSFTKIDLKPLTIAEQKRVFALNASSKKAAESFSLATNATAATKAAEAAPKTEHNVNLVPLSEYKVSSSAEKKSNFVTRFYDMMSRYFDGYKPYYLGLSLGGSATLNSPNQAGYFIGLGGYYELKERWVLGVELKLFNRMLLQQQIVEDYNTFINQRDSSMATGGRLYTATQLSRSNTYTAKSITGFELPITARYNLSKISLMFGVTASYIFPVKYTAAMGTQREADKTVTSPTALLSTTGQINQNDFAARFGLGYTFGAMYDLSKNNALDFRISQTLTKLPGSSNLSNGLYRAPVFQLSWHYFIGRRDKVIYMMNNSK